MVEGARLESVYTGNRIEGSNPSLSARIQTARANQRRAVFLCQIKAFSDVLALSAGAAISIWGPSRYTFWYAPGTRWMTAAVNEETWVYWAKRHSGLRLSLCPECL